MKKIKSKIITLNGSTEGDMCSFEDNFKFEDLITWVYRNCPSNLYIKVQDKEVSAIYENRIEIYYLEKSSVKH